MMMYIFVLYIDRICHIIPSLYIILLCFFGVCWLQLPIKTRIKQPHPKGGLQTGPGTWSYSEIGASLEDLYFQRSDAQRRAACFFFLWRCQVNTQKVISTWESGQSLKVDFVVYTYIYNIYIYIDLFIYFINYTKRRQFLFAETVLA